MRVLFENITIELTRFDVERLLFFLVAALTGRFRKRVQSIKLPVNACIGYPGILLVVQYIL